MTQERVSRRWLSAASAIRHAMCVGARSHICQIVGVILSFLLVAVLHRQNDGLWFQGDAPRHAMNGLFWWDLLTTWPRDPIDFAIRYYARYPAINPATYPPLFYIFEGLGFAALGPSPYVAKSIVLLFAVMAGAYTMAWARRWIGPLAGWAGAFLAFMPGIVLWTNGVMLNVPATAFGLATLYHFRRWLETACTKQLALTTLLIAAALMTYYPGGSVVCICAAWAVFCRRDLHADRRMPWLAGTALCALVPVAAALLLAPVQTSRHLPTMTFLLRISTWTFYWRVLPDVIGVTTLAIGSGGLAAGLFSERWRTETVYVVIWITALIVALSFLPARDPRYVLLVAPAFVIAATIGLSAIRCLRLLHPEWQAAALAVGLAVGFWSATRINVPHVSGFREIATYLRERAPKDAVLYDGEYDGLFGFYVRALDPGFERRLALGSKLLYEYGPGATFRRIQKSNVASTDDVLDHLRTRSGCRWVAIEVTPRPGLVLAQRLLREAVARPEFELVRSFPVTGAGARRIDLYRIMGVVDPIATVDLNFPSYTNRQFPDVVPIAR